MSELEELVKEAEYFNSDDYCLEPVKSIKILDDSHVRVIHIFNRWIKGEYAGKSYHSRLYKISQEGNKMV